MLYQIGEYAYPGVNAFLYALAFAVVVAACTGFYATYKCWNS